jgi:structural maintenance of chromosome 1
MKSLYPGVHGKLADLCRPIQKKYATAVSTAGGKHMDAIVVNTKHIASECIHYLKEHRIGTCSFLPLDNISPKDIPESLRSLSSQEKFRICIDLIDIDGDSDVYRPAVLYAVGTAIVCDNLDEARELCFHRLTTKNMKLKVVTLNGHVISKNGTMTGGAISRENGNNNRWEEKEIEKLRKEKIELEELILENKRNYPNRQQLIDIETKIKTIQIRLNLCSADSEICLEKKTQFLQQQNLRNEILINLNNEKNILKQNFLEKQNILENLIQKIREIEIIVFQQFSQRIGVENIREYEENRILKHKNLILQKNNLSEQKSTLVAQLEYEKKKDYESILQNSEKFLEVNRNEINLLKNTIQELTKETENTLTEYDILTQNCNELKKLKKSNDLKIKEKQIKKNNLIFEKENLIKKLSGQEILIERLKLQLREILKKAQVEEIALPAIVVRHHQHTSQGDHDDDKEEDDDESELVNLSYDLSWRGSTTTLRSQESLPSSSSTSSLPPSRRSHLGHHHSHEEDTSREEGKGKINPSTIQSDELLAIVDLSSITSIKGHQNKEFQYEKEKLLISEIKILTDILETMQPNMHAMERYDGVVEKLRECTNDLDTVRDTAKDITSRYDNFFIIF